MKNPFLDRGPRFRGGGAGLRRALQGGFLLLCLWIGWEFHRFMGGLGAPVADPLASRPPGVEGFLPISALLSLKGWYLTGEVHPVHPAGFFIFVAILALGWLFKRAFCSWLCPLGTLSECLGDAGARLLGRALRMPLWLDGPLRALKYLLLGFFLWAVWRMDALGLEAFLASPFNAVADLRLYLFFRHLSPLALGVVLALGGLSLLFRGFFCRYLCPYGALLGALSLLGPLRITRDPGHCVDCGGCARACPAGLPVDRVRRVHSDECTGCFRCVEACPAKGALGMRLLGGRALPSLPAWVFGLLVAGLFVAITGLARLTGHWDNGIPPVEYRQRMQEMDAREGRTGP